MSTPPIITTNASFAASALAVLKSIPSTKLNTTSVIVFSVACVFLLITIIVYIIWRIRRSDLKSVTLVDGPVRLYGGGAPLTISKSKIPPTLNGQEYTYSFWVYLVEYDATSHPMMLFGRGTQPGGLGGSPLVYLDKDTNKMYVSVSLNKTVQTSKLDDVPSSTSYVTAVVDYVPLQRWVNVVVVMQDYLMTVYLDGDMYTVENVTSIGDAGATTRGIFGPTSGDVVVGSAGSGPQAKAFISKLQFYNFALTHGDVRARYALGPVNPSALASMGVPGYGVRSPIYKIDQDGTSS